MFRDTQSNSWGYVTGNVLTTRPAAAFGTSITPGNNTYGSYTSILASGSIAYDCFWVVININNIAVSATAKDALVTIGIDDTGGTSYQTWIPDLLCGSAAPFTSSSGVAGGVNYAFPLYCKAGSQIAAKASVNNATVGTARVAIWLYGQPTLPSAIRYGFSVEALGITAASSSGTAVTPGTTSEGTWTSLGTTSKRGIFWQLGFGINDSTQNFITYTADLAVNNGSNAIVIIDGAIIQSDNVESTALSQPAAGWQDVIAGSTIYGRLQCSGTADSATSMAAYVVNI